ncbi:MAG: terminase small subunit [Burkholderiales bacterium]|nr:terminase small subunit [Burkholderiales bacterium]
MKNEHGLTPQQEAFAVGLAAGLTQAEAYRRAYPRAQRWKDETVWAEASKLAAHHTVRPRVEALLAKAAAESEITVKWCADRWRQIAEADPRELSELRRGCCRYCWGKGYRYQRTAGEMEREREAYEALPAAKRRGPFDERGGIGYHRGKPANPNCPECFGDGVERTHFKDVRTLSPAARRLYQGVKETKDGIEIKTLDQAHALVQLSRMAGLYEKDNRQKLDPLLALLQELPGNVMVPSAGAALPEIEDEGDDS